MSAMQPPSDARQPGINQMLTSMVSENQRHFSKNRVQAPIYDPHTQTSESFEKQMSALYNAPGWANISITGPRPQILDLLELRMMHPISLSPLPDRRSRTCGRGHLHKPWPSHGNVVVEKCERYCWFCKIEVKTAAALRKHVVQQHKVKGGMDIEVSVSTSGRSKNDLHGDIYDEGVPRPGSPALDFMELDDGLEKQQLFGRKPQQMHSSSSESDTLSKSTHHMPPPMSAIFGPGETTPPAQNEGWQSLGNAKPLPTPSISQRPLDVAPEAFRPQEEANSTVYHQDNYLKFLAQIDMHNQQLSHQTAAFKAMHEQNEHSMQAILTLLRTVYGDAHSHGSRV